MKVSRTEGGQRLTLNAALTTEHAASSYGQPVLVVDGEAIDAATWQMGGYRVESASGEEWEALQRSPFMAAAVGPGRPRMGEEKRQAVRMTLPPSEVEALREIGNGSASAGVSVLLRWWGDQCNV